MWRSGQSPIRQTPAFAQIACCGIVVQPVEANVLVVVSVMLVPALAPRASVQGKALRILHRQSSGDWKFSRIVIAPKFGAEYRRSTTETMKVLRFNACCSMLFEHSKRNRSKFPGSRPKSLRVCFQAFAAFFALAHRSLCALAIAKRPALEMRRRFFGSVRTSRCFFPEPFKTSMAELMDPSCFCSFDASAFNARTMFTE